MPAVVWERDLASRPDEGELREVPVDRLSPQDRDGSGDLSLVELVDRRASKCGRTFSIGLL